MPERYLGRTVGRFRIDSLVGSGGFAWVYRGYDSELDIPVAVKVLKPQFAGDETFESRFRAEASIAARLRHPHIIRILAVGREADAVYSVMDYLPHGLVDRLQTMTALPEPLAVRIGLHVADALAFAHREGVIHRDIKPDNILFDEHGNGIVADFGIACAVSGYVRQTGTNMVVGTPQYFSPEQARGLALDGRADIYSLGITLFRTATGALPFDGDDWYEIARQHVEDRPPKPRSLAPGMSPEFERVILRCLAKDPDSRFPSAEALREALAGLDSAGMDPARTPTVEIRPIRSSGLHSLHPRRRAVFAAAGALATLAAAAAIREARGDRAETTRIAAETSTASRMAVAAGEADGGTGALTPGGGVQPPPDSSLTADAASDTRRTAGLRVEAPRGALVYLDGHVVGAAPWFRDTLAPRRYEVAAAVPAIPRCESARQSRSVTLIAGQVERVPLRPIPCGELVLTTDPPSAVYTITSRESSKRWFGPTNGLVRLVLPEGRYALRVAAPPPCSPYETDSLVIAAGAPDRKRVPLIC